MSEDLIATARRLARAGANRPRQADLKRAVSTACYAMFHALARECADSFIGTGAARSREIWAHVYRAVDHGLAKSACRQASVGASAEIAAFAKSFVTMQEQRHRADYDPNARFSRAETQLLIANAEQAVAALRRAPRFDRRSFCAMVLLRRR